MNIYDVIQKPLITEKTSFERENRNILAFQVHNDANKLEIKKAVESLFKVDVTEVRTLMVAGKMKRFGKKIGKRSNWKKAYVTLKPGSSVDFFEV
ncbi:MAG: 50S ribosomal protein L23 [SAR324 cluster bacterium]|uniref:Large ribosomal subunit protein uL23 n=1 Tax=SAR324 cluster bacterium TaxID=2024889 RepID=A0A7X9FP75_9DELT|nr:50S ribosomal protein L23 [SAR324 cluster bacterium]